MKRRATATALTLLAALLGTAGCTEKGRMDEAVQTGGGDAATPGAMDTTSTSTSPTFPGDTGAADGMGAGAGTSVATPQ